MWLDGLKPKDRPCLGAGARLSVQCSREWVGGSFHLKQFVCERLRELKLGFRGGVPYASLYVQLELCLVYMCVCVCVFTGFLQNTQSCLRFAADPLLRGFVKIQGLFLFFFCLFLRALLSLTHSIHLQQQIMGCS